VQLHAYPQKFATFRQASDAAVPDTLKRAPSAPPSGDANCAATTADGALWLGTRAGLTRIDHATDPLDRKQYFAGRGYLPDDDVLNLVPDDSPGVWARTSTGVSHMRAATNNARTEG
jgi:ligand-binding sensor domain-containing protein